MLLLEETRRPTGWKEHRTVGGTEKTKLTEHATSRKYNEFALLPVILIFAAAVSGADDDGGGADSANGGNLCPKRLPLELQ